MTKMTNPHTPAPVLTIDQVVEKIAEHRAKGHKIVTTNGVFDLLHPGHMDYLQKTRALGDVLVVAINSDASTKRIKGANRPYWGEKERALMLASLRWVDYVTTFEEDTPVEILSQLKPDLHVKAGDYKPDTMPETHTVRANNGDVLCVPVEQSYSSSALVQKIRSENDDKSFVRPAYVSSYK